MEDKIIELIETINNSNSQNFVIVICSVISCFVAVLSVIISIYLGYIQYKDKYIRKKVLGFIYKYYKPVYVITELPTTKMIKKSLKNILISEKDVFDTLIILNKEKLIEAVSDTNTDLDNVQWKPHMIFYKGV